MFSLGLDIGGTKCAAVLGRTGAAPDNLILDRVAFPTRTERGWRAVLDEAVTACRTLLARHGVADGDLDGIGVSCGGPLDAERGVILSPPNLPGWDAVPITALLRETFGVRAVLRNDADACALAEWRYGAGQGSRNMIFLTFGTGMGAGLILNGALYSGANGLAGEVGHLRLAADGPLGYGKRGSFEGFCSGGGIVDLTRLHAEEYIRQNKKSLLLPNGALPPDLSAATVAQALERGDALAREVLTESAEKLGEGLAVLVDLFAPERIVIGSIYARNAAFFAPIARERMEREALSQSAAACEIVPAALGDAIGDYAALGVLEE